MTKFTFSTFMIIIAMLFSACSEADETLPTLAILPTLEPSNTPTETFTPTSTDIPTLTPTETPTSTATATVTSTATTTPRPSATPTNTLTFTPTATATSTLTATPAATATPLEPVILSFSSNANSSISGGTITLTWQSQADSARIERLNAAGTITETVSVPPSASLNVTIPAGSPTVIYRLVAVRGSNTTTLSLSISVTQACSFNWFFTAPPELGCPSGPAVSSPAVYQTFQRGVMFRIQVNGLDRVCGIQNDRNRYLCFGYLAYSGVPPVSPPPGTQAPAPELQDVFYNRLAIGGFWYDIIGWGAGAPSNAALLTQSDSQNRLYIQTPLGTLRFDAGLTEGPVSTVP